MRIDAKGLVGHRLSRDAIVLVMAWTAAAQWSSLALAAAPEAPGTGEQIYQRMCASCHGRSGEGTVEHYPKILTGERSIASLAKYIAKTMPEDEPGTCVGVDADRVASYMYDAFYSKAAQERNALPLPRIELSRLTVRQYRNAVADLIASFGWQGTWDDKRGLKAEYNSRTRRRRRGADAGQEAGVQRIDAEVSFQFGDGSPIPEQDAVKDLSRRWIKLPLAWVPLRVFRPFSQEFRANWQGGVLAPETGDYEFVVRTENATRLWVNEHERPLIDASVKSGNDTEYRESIYLVGGRVYHLKLELNRSKEKTSSIALLWKRPHRTIEPIPSRYLSPSPFPESLIVKTPFPPDDRSVGYERGTSVSKAWDQATTDAAIETAGYVVAHLKVLAGAGDDAKDREKKLREFCTRFVERAFRRPLSPEQKNFFIDRQFAGTRGLDLAVRRVVLLALKSPRFLYREINARKLDGYDVASRLSFGMWDSIPDQALLDSAAGGRLGKREEALNQARRMATDLKATAKLREFFLQWLRVEQGAEIAKDMKVFPGFDEAVVSDLRTSLELFLEEVLASPSSDFREMFTADYVHLNGRLAKIYGASLPADAPFQKIKRQPNEQGGVLSHPYLMSSFAYTASSSPIHRGVFLSRSVLGRALRPPPEAVAPLAADLHPGLTTRERVLLQTKPESCQSCHGMINSLGFALEHFDAIGRYRDREKDRPIDATGSYETRTGERVPFDGLRELAAFLSASDETQTALVQQLFHYLVKQPIGAFGRKTLSDLRGSFAENGYNLRSLMTEIIASSALAATPDPPPKSTASPSSVR